jgi:sister chromatid cohesion protein PDS5
MERIFPRLLHLLAHHTDFSTQDADLDDMLAYITFYLDCICTADNCGLLFHMAQRLKSAQDALLDEKSEAPPRSVRG